MRRNLVLTQFLLLAVPALPLRAQGAPRSAVGARVRLMTPTLAQHPQLVGRITAVDSAAVTIHTDLGDDMRLPTSLITEVAVSGGTTPSRVSVVRGAVAGLLLGAVAGRLSTREHRENQKQTGSVYAMRGGIFGALAGAAFGAVNRPERWEAVALRGETLNPQPPETSVSPR